MAGLPSPGPPVSSPGLPAQHGGCLPGAQPLSGARRAWLVRAAERASPGPGASLMPPTRCRQLHQGKALQPLAVAEPLAPTLPAALCRRRFCSPGSLRPGSGATGADRALRTPDHCCPELALVLGVCQAWGLGGLAGGTPGLGLMRRVECFCCKICGFACALAGFQQVH